MLGDQSEQLLSRLLPLVESVWMTYSRNTRRTEPVNVRVYMHSLFPRNETFLILPEPQNHLWKAFNTTQQLSWIIWGRNAGTWSFRCCKYANKLTDNRHGGYANCSAPHSRLPFILPRSMSSHVISPYQAPASHVQLGCFPSLQKAVGFRALRLGGSCRLPDPSALASSGSSWRLSFHSRGASQGVTVTDSGVLSSSTMKKYLRVSSDPMMILIATVKTCQKSYLVFMFLPI